GITKQGDCQAANGRYFQERIVLKVADIGDEIINCPFFQLHQQISPVVDPDIQRDSRIMRLQLPYCGVQETLGWERTGSYLDSAVFARFEIVEVLAEVTDFGQQMSGMINHEPACRRHEH